MTSGPGLRSAPSGRTASEAPAVRRRSPGPVPRWVLIAPVVLATVLAGVLAAAIDAAGRDGVPYRPLLLEGRVPATLYMPGSTPPGLLAGLPDPPPAAAPRPPLVVLVHGHSADRNTVSVLARRTAGHGYPVLAIDLAGHGESRVPFRVGPEGWRSEIGAALTWAGTSPHVDGDRVVLVGHSLGAAAVLDAATHDPRPVATIAIGGGPSVLQDGVRPPEPSFLLAAGDSPVVRAGVDRAARAWSADGPAPVVEIPGTDHLGILFSGRTADEVAARVARVAGPGVPAAVDDGRIAPAITYLLVLPVVAVGAGMLAGRVPGPATPVRAAAPAPRRRAAVAVGRIAAPAVAAAVVVPWAAGPAGAGTGLEAGGALAVLLAGAGVLLLAAWPVARRWGWVPPLPDRRPAVHVRSAAAGVAGLVAVLLLLLPVTPLLRSLSLTPERWVPLLLTTALVLPAALAVDCWLRFGTPVRGALRSAAGWTLLLGLVLPPGVVAGLLPGMLLLQLIALLPVLLLSEVAAAGLRAAGRDGAGPVLLQTAIVALLITVLSPVL